MNKFQQMKLSKWKYIFSLLFPGTERFTKAIFTVQKMKFSIKDFFSKCDQIRSFLRIWSHLRKKPLMENFIFLCSSYCIRWFWNNSTQIS